MADFTIDLLLLIILLALSAFFAASEVAFLSMSNVKLHSLVQKKAPGAELLHALSHKRRRVIISLVIGNTLANIALSAIATSMAIRAFGDAGVGIAVGIISFLILTFGEIAPKSAATTYGEKMALLLAAPISVFYAISLPLVVVFEFINRLIPGVYARATGLEYFTEAEVRSAVKLGAQHKSISEREKQLIENVLELNDREVSKSMTPRASLMVMNANLQIEEAHRIAVASNYSRFPVLKNNQVVGVVSVKTLGWALQNRPHGTIGDVVTKPILVKGTENVGEVFNRLQNLGRNIAIVVDEKGEFAGIVTLEDLLEEIVGEIK